LQNIILQYQYYAATSNQAKLINRDTALAAGGKDQSWHPLLSKCSKSATFNNRTHTAQCKTIQTGPNTDSVSPLMQELKPDCEVRVTTPVAFDAAALQSIPAGEEGFLCALGDFSSTLAGGLPQHARSRCGALRRNAHCLSKG
jgi:hypothetical protein